MAISVSYPLRAELTDTGSCCYLRKLSVTNIVPDFYFKVKFTIWPTYVVGSCVILICVNSVNAVKNFRETQWPRVSYVRQTETQKRLLI